MEEVGKYESIQDRIKRLTKNQSTTPTANFKEKLEAFSTMNSTPQDSQKQNMNRLNFVKKRQSSQSSFRTVTSRQPVSNHERPFDLITNLTTQSAQSYARQISNEIRKTSNQYAIRKPTRQFLDEGNQNWDFNNYNMKRNDSAGNFMGMSVQNIIERYSIKKIQTHQDQAEQCTDKSYLHDGSKESTGFKRAQCIKKTEMSANINRQESGDVSCRRSMEEEGLKRIIKNQSSEGQQLVLNRKMGRQAVPTEACGQTAELRSRMITRCNSGMLERVPGRIIKNR